MPPKFWSKIVVESQDSGFDVAEVEYEEIVLAMLEQIERNLLNPQLVDLPIHFANTFDDFQALIEEPELDDSIPSQSNCGRAETTFSFPSKVLGGSLGSYGRSETTQTESFFWTCEATI